MGSFSHYPLQKAVFQALSADTGLLSQITGVFDRPPQNQAYPYVMIGESSISDWSTKTTSGTEQVISLHIWSREGGRKQNEIIMEKVHSLLHDAAMTVDGNTLVLIKFVSSSIAIENDGWTYHGIMRFRALLQYN